jgi:type IV pilus assembly protein PilX
MKIVMQNQNRVFRQRPASNQQGVVLIIALIAIAAMSLAGIALVRSVESANIAAGNLSFRQSSLQSADLGLETALGKFVPGGAYDASDTITYSNIVTENYSAAILPEDYRGIPTVLLGSTTTFDSLPNFKVGKISRDGYDVRYVVERLCTVELMGQEPNENYCLSNDFSGGGTIDPDKPPPKFVPLFRATARVDGPRGTLSFSQVNFSPLAPG